MYKPPETNLAIIIDHLIVEGVILVVGRLAIEGVWMGVAGVHCYQTAERIREVHPDKEWFQLTGLIHDLGKVLAVWGEPQYAVVGDTFPVGCAFSPKCVFPEMFEGNPDSKDSRYK